MISSMKIIKISAKTKYTLFVTMKKYRYFNTDKLQLQNTSLLHYQQDEARECIKNKHNSQNHSNN